MHHEVKTIAGVTTLFAEIPTFNSTTVQVLVKAGSIYETKETNGISHFLEHLFFKGGKKYPTPKAVAEVVDAFGGEFNAFTSEEYAGYYVKCAPEYIALALGVLADMMLDAQFPNDELEREKGVVIQEIKMYEDNPRRQVSEKRKERYYGDNSYGRSVLGTVDTVKSFRQDDLFAHKQKLYAKDNLVIVVAGALPDKADIEQQIGELFSDLPETKSSALPVLLPYKPSLQEASYDQKTQQNHVILSADGFSTHHNEKYAASVLATLFGGTMSSRLFQEIREKQGLCYYVGASHYENDADGVFFIRAWIEKERRQQWLQAIYTEIAKIAEGDVTQTEVDLALGNVKWRTQMGIETSDQLANFVGFQRLFEKNIETMEEILAKYEAVTLADVQRVAEKLHKKHVYAYRIQ